MMETMKTNITGCNGENNVEEQRPTRSNGDA
jgi:hypothetical protein